jgi:heptosyltransferase II
MEILTAEENILVIQTAFIGDAVLTLPMLQKLKEIYPGSRIDVIAIPTTAEIFEASPAVDNVFILRKKDEHKSIFSLKKFVKKIKNNNYTRIISPHRSFRTSLIVMWLGVRESTGFSNSSLVHVYKNIVEYIPAHHEVQRNLELIGINSNGADWEIIPKISINEDIKKKVDDFFLNFRYLNNYYAVAPGSIWNTKKYPEEYYIELINRLSEGSSGVIILGGKDDLTLCERIAAKFGENVISAAGKFSLIESIELLKGAKILISNDSAPAHLGVCADIPVLTLYCSTVPGFGFYPYNPGSSYLSYDELPCKPCGIHGYSQCPINTFECAYNLKPIIVLRKIQEMLNEI